jgi:hypothetical protein
MNSIPFPNANRATRRAWVADVDAALDQAEGLLQAVNIPLVSRLSLKVDIAQVRAALAVESRSLNGDAR